MRQLANTSNTGTNDSHLSALFISVISEKNVIEIIEPRFKNHGITGEARDICQSFGFNKTEGSKIRILSSNSINKYAKVDNEGHYKIESSHQPIHYTESLLCHIGGFSAESSKHLEDVVGTHGDWIKRLMRKKNISVQAIYY